MSRLDDMLQEMISMGGSDCICAPHARHASACMVI